MSGLPVVVGLGEALWDVYPDAERFGGAPANVAMHAAALGAASWLVSAVGADARGDRALAALAEAGVRTDAVARDAAHATGAVLVTLDAEGRPTFRIAADAAWDHMPWPATGDALAARADAVCFGTLAQRGAVSRGTIRRFVAACRPSALRVFDVNLRQHWFDREVLEASLRLADVVKLNDEELPVVARVCGVAADAGSSRGMLEALCARYDLRVAALTMGPRGALVLSGGVAHEAAAPAVTPVDTVGAGDAFTAALIVGLLAGRDVARVARDANTVAAYVCTRAGATPRLPEALRGLFAE